MYDFASALLVGYRKNDDIKIVNKNKIDFFIEIILVLITKK